MSQLIIRIPNWVGDAIMALPTLQELAARGFELHCVGKKWLADLFAATEYKCYPLPKSYRQAAKLLRNIPAKQMLLLPNSLSSALQSRLAGKATIAYIADHRKFLLSHAIQKSTSKQLHEVEIFWQLAGAAFELWGDKTTYGNWPESSPQQFSLPLAEHLTNKPKLFEKYLVLCPFAIGSINGKSKIWPGWQQLINYLVTDHPHLEIVICPGPGDLQNSQLNFPTTINIIENTSLAEAAAIMQQADLVIANDSGPMHIASALGTNLLGLFGISNPTRTRPWMGNYLGKPGEWPSVAQVLEFVTDPDNQVGKA